MIVIHWKGNRKHIINTLRGKTAELLVFNDVVHTALWSPQSHSLRYPLPVVFFSSDTHVNFVLQVGNCRLLLVTIYFTAVND